MREDKKTDKVTAIYKAIEELVAAGADLSSMRVSDIAAKAGIGKGTTYEYFSSKEEMVVKAMFYSVGSMVKRIVDRMEKLPAFQDAFILLLDEMEEKAKQRTCIMKYLSMVNDMNLCQQIHDVMVADQDAKEANPINIIRYLLERGQKEGILCSDYSRSYMESVMFSRIISFIMFIGEEFESKDCTNDEMKLALYQGVCRELGA